MNKKMEQKMTKIEEILGSHFELINMNGSKCEPDLETLQVAVSTGLDYDTLIEAMEEYAEWYANKCLEIAAGNARIQVNCGTGIERVSSLNFSEYNILHECFIDDRTILNIDLPEHE